MKRQLAAVLLGLSACFSVHAAGTASAGDGARLAAASGDYALTDQLIVRLKTADTSIAASPATAKSAPAQSTPARATGDAHAERRLAVTTRLQMLTAETLTPLRTMSDGSDVIRLPRRMPPAEVQAIINRLSADPEVLEVLPDRLFFPQLTPNDPQYVNQWSLNAANGINMPAAWDITTGSSSMVIGLLDTGMLPHNDLAGRWIGGYDFVSLAERSNDGNLRDSDPTDPGDWVTTAESASGPLAGCPVTDSRWHGTAMAGIIGANANNAAGIAGINWNAKILPVRVVGKCGGYESDIIDGMRWSAGISVPGVPDNPDPAAVLNLSLAAPGACSLPMQNAINDVIATGAPVVVAAGNSGANASGYSPGNCNAAIAVGAVDRNGGKSAYTNFGATLVLSAPGGLNTNDDSTQNILTTANAGTTSASPANDLYRTSVGSSVAAAQVTGVTSLLRSVNPTLSPVIATEILRNTSRVFPVNTTAQGSQADCTTALCGAGIVDARAVVQAASQWGHTVSQVSGGFRTAVALRADGSVVTWGPGIYGALGNGGTTDSPVPVAVPALTGIVRLSTGTEAFHHLALRADGIVWAWGKNSDGQLGDGSQTDRTSPVRIGGLSDVTQVAAGDRHSLALKRDGTVMAWGLSQGFSSDYSGNHSLAPTLIPEFSGATAIAASELQSFALKSDGTVWSNTYPGSSYPGLTQIVAIAAGRGHLLALRSDGTVWAMGDSWYGVLGDGIARYDVQGTPIQVPGLANVIAIAAGSYFSMALKADGSVWVWGGIAIGEFTSNDLLSPAQVPGISGVARIGAGTENAYMVKPDGSVWAMGGGSYGALGTNTLTDATLPVRVLGQAGIGMLNLGVTDPTGFAPQTDLASGSVGTSNAIVVTGIISSAGISIAGGQYSIGCTATFTSAPGTINNNASVCIRVTAAPNCGTTTTSTLSIAGSPQKTFVVSTAACDSAPNRFRLIPQGNVLPGTTVTSSPVTITGINMPAPVSIAGGTYSVGCTATFTAATGTIVNNATVCVRQTAAASNNSLTTATLTIGGMSANFEVMTQSGSGFSAARQVSGGRYFAHAVDTGGAVYVWGLRDFANANAGVESWQAYPTLVPALSGVVGLGVGTLAIHALAIRTDGTLWAWGNNASGQLGDGTQLSHSDPVRVTGISGVSQAAVSINISLALKTDGTVWVWGDNSGVGLVGDGSTYGHRLFPVAVPGLNNVAGIATTGGTNFALAADGSVRGWGANVGPTPVVLAGFAQVTSIAAGLDHLLALLSDGTVAAWGTNLHGQLGNGTTTSNNSANSPPTIVAGLTGVTGIAAGRYFSLALKSDGTVWAWGFNQYGRLGDGTTSTRLTPVQVSGLTGVVRIATSNENGFAIKAEGSVWSWGGGYGAVLGNNVLNGGDALVPVQVVGPGGTGTLGLGVADPAVFAPQTGIPVSSLRVSNTIAVTGIANGASISITGGEYSVGCTATFSSSAGTINNTNTVCVRQTSSASCSTTTVATLNIAGFPAKLFSVTTLVCDTTPNRFYFIPQGNVPPGSQITSAAAYISGITGPTPVSVTGGEYSINCIGTYTNSPGTILALPVSGYLPICVRQIAAATNDTMTTATLTAGGVSAPFDVITRVAPSFAVTPQLAPGWLSVQVLRADGSIYSWGGVSSLGDGRVGFDIATPNLISALSGISRLSVGPYEINFGLAVRNDGTLWTWGDNRAGQLGNGNTNSQNMPGRLQGLPPMVRVARGTLHSLALSASGTVWSWGNNAVGQLGDGTTIGPRLTPVAIAGLAGIVDIAAYGESIAFESSNAQSFALKSDGTVWGWGSSLGTAPAPIAGFAQIIAIASGQYSLVGLKSDGTVWVWGANPGNGVPQGMIGAAVQVGGLNGVVAITAGFGHTMVLKNDGTVWAWGDNTYGQLGDGTTANRYSPVQVVGANGAIQIAAGYQTSFALFPNGTVRAWGNAYSGALGSNAIIGSEPLPRQVLGVKGEGFLSLAAGNSVPAPFAFLAALGVQTSTITASNPVFVSGLGSGVASPIAIAGGEYSVNGAPFTMSAGTVHNDDRVVTRVMSSASFGTVTSASVSIGGTFNESSTFLVRTRSAPNRTAVIPEVAAGNSQSYVLSSNGTVYAVGYNGNGQLGNGTTLSTAALLPVAGLGKIAGIAAGANHGLALRDDNTVTAWGYNAGGQLGSGVDSNSERYFVAVSGLTNVVAIAAGDYHSIALKQDGTVWAWGLNVDGQIGQGNTTTPRYLTPVPVIGLTGVTAIAAGGRHNLAVRADGSVVAWGSNSSGQLGDGTTTNRSAPVAVPALTSGILSVAAGGAHSLALKTDSSVMSWGDNAFGQLGIGSQINHSTPVAALGAGVALIAAGANHSLAVKTGGSLYTWGANTNSQLGDGATANRSTPFNVVNPTNIVAIAGGGRHSAAIDNKGKLFLWGDNYFGQVGNKSGNYNPNTATLNVLRGDSEISTVAQAAGSSTGTSSSSGSAVIEINEIASGFDFSTSTVSTAATPALGKFKNQALTDAITDIGVSVSGSGFSLQSTDCPMSLNAGTECNFAIGFIPAAPGDAVGELQVASSLIGSPERRSLFGTGLAPATPGLKINATAGEAYLSFAPQTIGTQSAAADVILTNTGSATLAISSISLTTGAADFSVPATCTTNINAGASCTLPVTFIPSQANGIDGQLTIVSNAPTAGTQIVTLAGTGVGNGMPLPLTLTGAVSRKVHGAAGSLDVVIDRSKTISQAITTEPRSIGNGHVIVFTFNLPIAQTGSATAVDATPTGIGNIASVTAQGSSVFVTVTGIPDRSRATVTLSNVNGLVNSFPISIGFMLGDVTNNGAVNAGDIAVTKARVSQAVGTGTQRYDVDASGVIDTKDVSMVKARTGMRLP